eukprot:1187351-Alexandrium_andersonii.AAC.1
MGRGRSRTAQDHAMWIDRVCSHAPHTCTSIWRAHAKNVFSRRKAVPVATSSTPGLLLGGSVNEPEPSKDSLVPCQAMAHSC